MTCHAAAEIMSRVCTRSNIVVQIHQKLKQKIFQSRISLPKASSCKLNKLPHKCAKKISCGYVSGVSVFSVYVWLRLWASERLSVTNPNKIHMPRKYLSHENTSRCIVTCLDWIIVTQCHQDPLYAVCAKLFLHYPWHCKLQPRRTG